MKKTALTLSAFAIIGAVMFNSCKKDDTSTTTPAATDTSLYGQVGGTTMVADPANSGTMIEKGRLTLRSVVDSAILVIAGDPKLNTTFFPQLLSEYVNGHTTGFSALSKTLTDFLQDATGRAAKVYAGKSMKDAHNPATNSRMNAAATAADFDQFIGDVGKSLNKNGVASTTKLYSDLVALLETVKPDAVQNTTDASAAAKFSGLYTRVGGSAMITDDSKHGGGQIETGRHTLRSVVDSAIYVIAADASMKPFFGTLLGEVGGGNTTGFAKLSGNLTDFLCVATGSKTATYGGLSMKAAHNPATNPRMGTKAADADFNKFIGDVGTALGKNGVKDAALIGDLVALLNTTKPDVIQK